MGRKLADYARFVSVVGVVVMVPIKGKTGENEPVLYLADDPHDGENVHGQWTKDVLDAKFLYGSGAYGEAQSRIDYGYYGVPRGYKKPYRTLIKVEHIGSICHFGRDGYPRPISSDEFFNMGGTPDEDDLEIDPEDDDW